MTDPRTLLAEYVASRSEPAFGELVARYMDLVHSTALRLVDGDTHRAADVAQSVFADLAQRAATLSPDVMLGGWLHRRTCHVAWTLLRAEFRRQKRERQAAEMHALETSHEADFAQIAPVLDEAVNQLSHEDRTAILLRFFEGCDLRSVGEVLGSNEDAAQKRVARALEKLRVSLGRRGITASASALAGVLGTSAVGAAPAGLALSVSSAALATTGAGGGLSLTLLKLMAMTKLKIALGIVVVGGVATTLLVEYGILTRLREQNQALQQQITRLTREAEQRPPGALGIAPTNDPAASREEQLRDLRRLRGEVGALRQQTNALARLRTENREWHAATGEPEDPAEADFEVQTEERVAQLKQWGLSFFLYARDHRDLYPETFEEAASILNSQALLEFGTNHFEIVYRGTSDAVKDPGRTLIFRERQARHSPKGEWVKAYGYADGHVETHTEPDEAGFEAWEKDQVMSPR